MQCIFGDLLVHNVAGRDHQLSCGRVINPVSTFSTKTDFERGFVVLYKFVKSTGGINIQ